MATVTVEYFGVSGTGKTVKEAKQNAGNKIETCLGRPPKTYAWRGCSVFIYWTPDSGEYRLTHPDSDGQIHGCNICFDDEVENTAIMHLLSIAPRKIGEEYDVPLWVPAYLRDNAVREWKRNDSFQTAYKHALTLPVDQLPAGGPHSWACEHQCEFAIA